MENSSSCLLVLFLVLMTRAFGIFGAYALPEAL